MSRYLLCKGANFHISIRRVTLCYAHYHLHKFHKTMYFYYLPSIYKFSKFTQVRVFLGLGTRKFFRCYNNFFLCNFATFFGSPAKINQIITINLSLNLNLNQRKKIFVFIDIILYISYCSSKTLQQAYIFCFLIAYFIR